MPSFFFCPLSVPVPSAIYGTCSLRRFFQCSSIRETIAAYEICISENSSSSILSILTLVAPSRYTRSHATHSETHFAIWDKQPGIVGKHEWSSNERASAAVPYDPITTVMCRDCVSAMLNLMGFWYCCWFIDAIPARKVRTLPAIAPLIREREYTNGDTRATMEKKRCIFVRAGYRRVISQGYRPREISLSGI